MVESSDPVEVRKKAMDLLARREYSVYELADKLRTRGYDDDSVAEVVEELQRERLLSDERLIDDHVDPRDAVWDESMRRQRERKFGASIPGDYATRMKQARFLQNRGFSPAAVMRLFR